MSQHDEPPQTGERDPRRPWVPPAFTRLARTHALSVAGDTFFMAAMAGTVFFSVADFDEARGRVALLLLFTIAPFAVAAPLIGPLLDRARGGRRWMIIGINICRALLCVLLIRHRHEWLFYPEALAMLVLSKGYLISRGAVVPTTVRSDSELVKANAKLTLLSGVTAALSAAPAGLMLWVGGPSFPLAGAMAIFAGAAILAAQLPKTRVAESPPDEAEREELRSLGIRIAASSMGAVRLIVGFMVFQIGFFAKDNDLPLLMAAAAGTAQAGFLVGSLVAPILRRHITEERILAVALAVTAVAGGGSVLVGIMASGSNVVLGLAASLLCFGVGVTANVAKQAFDAIVQRDAPDANRGRSFARFETRFQLVWVVGALIPTALVLPMELGFVVVAGIAVFALVSYVVGRKRAAAGQDPRIVRLPLPNWPQRGSEPEPDHTQLPPPPEPAPEVPTRRRFFAGRLTTEPPTVAADATTVAPDPTTVTDAPTEPGTVTVAEEGEAAEPSDRDLSGVTPPLPGFEPEQGRD